MGKDLHQLPISDSFSIKADIVLVGAGVFNLIPSLANT